MVRVYIGVSRLGATVSFSADFIPFGRCKVPCSGQDRLFLSSLSARVAFQLDHLTSINLEGCTCGSRDYVDTPLIESRASADNGMMPNDSQCKV